ncbi:MAG: S-layer homology domain-containing protein [Clostridiaceae bacterium]|nr:S-layer homology domain-containing protein [Clostridiaceae bacterium]
MKRYINPIAFGLILTVILSLCNFNYIGYAAFKDVPADAIYAEAVERLSTLGIISGNSNGSFSPMDTLNRAQFAKIAVSAAGLKEQALSEAGVSFYSDVPAGHWASGYINVAARQGYITGYGDGNFRPDEPINYSQVITVLLKILGYTPEGLGGVWPYNYIEKAKALGITDGIQFKSTDIVTRGIAALMVDRTLFKEVNNEAANGSKVTLLEKSGLASVKECIITATYGTDDSVTLGRVKTDIGEFTTSIGNMDDYIGRKVKVIINKNNEIINVSLKPQSVKQVMVKSITGNDISVLGTLNGAASASVFTLPDSLTVYYKGEKGTFMSNKANISLGSMIVLSGAFEGSYDYAVLLDPRLEGPVTVTSDVKESDNNIGSIDISKKGNIQVIRNGENASLTDIKAYDVVYLLKNAPDKINRLFVYDNKITGIYEEALPSKAFVNKIKVSGVELELETHKAVSKLDESPGAYRIKDSITVLLGINGKVVDVVDLNASDLSNMAVVVNAREAISEKAENKGQREYYVKLFKTDGTVQEYKADNDYTNIKGELVTFKFKDGLAILHKVSYTPVSGVLDKNERTLDGIWLSKQPVILDLISNPKGSDAVVKKVELAEMSMNRLRDKEVIHAERRNKFGDIELLFLNNATYSSYQYGILTKKEYNENGRGTNSSYEFYIKGQKYNASADVIFAPVRNQPIAVEMEGNKINSMFALNAVESSAIVEAYDEERIKVKNKIYRLAEDVQVYKKEGDGNFIPVSLNKLDTDKSQRVSIYSERDIKDGGKIRVIIIH